MSDGRVKLMLEPRFDSYGKKYFIAKVKAPISIDCKDGCAFMIFISEDGSEEMHICPMDNNLQKKHPQVYRMNREATSMPEVLEDLDKNVR